MKRQCSEQQFKAEGINHLRRLLARAPEDSTWRRRGLLVMCHAFAGKTGVGSATNEAVDDGIQHMYEESDGAEAKKRSKAPTSDASTANSNDDDRGENALVRP